MKRTFESENSRKNKLFDAWIEYLRILHARPDLQTFDEIYEGLAEITSLAENRIGLCLADKRKINGVSISPRIHEFSDSSDHLYLALGRIREKWWPLHLISIGSLLSYEGGQSGLHMSVNPLLTVPLANSTQESFH